MFSIYEVMYLSLMHVYIFVFYCHNAVIALKIYLVSQTFLILSVFLEIIYQMPRAYWLSDNIVTNYCFGSYAFPGTTQITFLFLIVYLKFSIGDDALINKKYWKFLYYSISLILYLVFICGIFLTA